MEPSGLSSVIAGFLQPLLWMLPLLLWAALLGWLRPRLIGAAGEKAVSRVLRRMFVETLDDVILPDGRGGLTQIDHLALTPAGLLVVETKNYGGSIFGQTDEPTWTQAIGGQRNRFQNPLRQNFGHIAAVKFHAPGVPVLGRVVFTNRARFPKGMPEGVVALAGLRSSLRNLLGGDISPPTRLAWERLRGAMRAGHRARAEHLQGIKHRQGASPGRAGRLATAASGARRSATGPVRARTSFPLTSAAGWRDLAVVAIISLAGLVALSMLAQHLGRTARSPSPGISFAPSAPASASRAEQRIARTMPSPKRAAPTAQQRPVVEQTQIEWSTPTRQTQRKEACNAAIAALLVDNSPAQRRQRDRLCGPDAGNRASPDSATAAQVRGASRTLRSAAELTRERSGQQRR